MVTLKMKREKIPSALSSPQNSSEYVVCSIIWEHQIEAQIWISEVEVLALFGHIS